MTAKPLRRWETLLALAAVVLAAGALLPLAPAIRIACACTAILTVVVLSGMRLRAFLAPRAPAPPSETYAKIARIRAARGPRRR